MVAGGTQTVGRLGRGRVVGSQSWVRFGNLRRVQAVPRLPASTREKERRRERPVSPWTALLSKALAKGKEDVHLGALIRASAVSRSCSFFNLAFSCAS